MFYHVHKISNICLQKTLFLLLSLWYTIDRKREGNKQMKWRIFGQGLKDLIIIANSFDKALTIARKINSNYNGGQRI